MKPKNPPAEPPPNHRHELRAEILPHEPAITIITTVRPVDRYALQNDIANLRQMLFDGVQVPFRVIHVDPYTRDERKNTSPGAWGAVGRRLEKGVVMVSHVVIC